jgi:hypothetical protein
MDELPLPVFMTKEFSESEGHGISLTVDLDFGMLDAAPVADIAIGAGLKYFQPTRSVEVE